MAAKAANFNFVRQGTLFSPQNGKRIRVTKHDIYIYAEYFDFEFRVFPPLTCSISRAILLE